MKGLILLKWTKNETGKYNRNFNLFKRIINLHYIFGGGAKNNESLSIF